MVKINDTVPTNPMSVKLIKVSIWNLFCGISQTKTDEAQAGIWQIDEHPELQVLSDQRIIDLTRNGFKLSLNCSINSKVTKDGCFNMGRTKESV